MVFSKLKAKTTLRLESPRVLKLLRYSITELSELGLTAFKKSKHKEKIFIWQTWINDQDLWT